MSEELTNEEKSTNYDTLRHMEAVRNVINEVIRELLTRGEYHDQEKTVQPELEHFAAHHGKLSCMHYNSPEYQKSLEELRPALSHHYSKCRHHPQHFENYVNDMNLIDVMEMFCDWKASSERNKDGNLLTSIKSNKKRFKMSKQLVDIFTNTAVLFDNKKNIC